MKPGACDHTDIAELGSIHISSMLLLSLTWSWLPVKDLHDILDKIDTSGYFDRPSEPQDEQVCEWVSDGNNNDYPSKMGGAESFKEL